MASQLQAAEDSMSEPSTITPVEDLLSRLPISTSRQYAGGEIVYDFASHNTHLHLVLNGFVAVVRRRGGRQVVLSLCKTDEFFGEAAIVGGSEEERAAASGPATVMSWPAERVMELAYRQPALGVALSQMLVCRCASLEGRLVSLSLDSPAQRLAAALLTFAEVYGEPEPSEPGCLRIGPISHEMLAQYIGSTRATVTRALLAFRRNSWVRYTRSAIVIHPEALRQWLHDYRRAPEGCLPGSME